MLRILACVLALFMGGTAVGQQDTPSHPKVSWQARCGGVTVEELDNAYREALAHVRSKGKDESAFLRGIRNCPKRDLKYYKAVLRRWNK